MIASAFAGVFFASIAVVAMAASRAYCANIEPAEDGPAPGTPPYAVLAVAAGVVGALLIAAGATPLQLGIAAILTFALVACWCSDTLCGLVPDVFTLVPLAALLLFAFAQRNWEMAISATVAFAPFAAAAFFSRGYGMGWGDAKLVALCGAALGAPVAIFSLSIACAAAVVVHRLRGSGHSPIAFAPYIAAASGVVLPLGFGH